MPKMISTAKNTIAKSVEFAKKTDKAYENKAGDSKAFIAESKENSEVHQRIQKLRKSIESK